MTALPLLMVLSAAVAHAGWNLASKRAGASGVPFVWLNCAGSTILLAPVAIISIGQNAVYLGAWVLAGAVSGMIHTVYFTTLQRGYARGDVSVVYPLARGTGPMLSVVFAIILFGERPGWLGLAGAGGVVAGVMVIALSTRSPSAKVGRQSAALPGVLFGLATGVMIAAYTLWDAHAVKTVLVFPVALMWMSTLTQTILLAPVAWRNQARLAAVARSYWREALTVAVLSPLAYILVLFALQRAPVSLVAPIREVSVVLVSLAGSLLFKEAAIRQRLSGAIIVLAGVAMLAAS